MLTSGTGTAYPSRAPEFPLVFSGGSCYSILSFMCMFCRSLFVLLYFFCRTLCCIFFFDIRILFTPLISSNSTYICEGRYLTHMWKHLHDHIIQQVWVHNTSLTLPHLIEVAVPTRGEWTVMHVRVVRIGLSPFLRVSHWILKLFWWCCIDLFFIFLGKISVLVVLYFFFRKLIINC